MAKMSVKKFLELNENNNNLLKVRRLTGLSGLDNFITGYEVNRPGMALFKYFEDFAYDRIQVFGQGEGNYVIKLDKENNTGIFRDVLNYTIPICVFTTDIMPPDSFLSVALERNIPVLISELRTNSFIRAVATLLEDEFATVLITHGVFIEVFGVGVFIKGKSGVGKSEATLELISKGHRLIADDSVELRRLNDGLIIGKSSKILQHYMEVRGIGIVDIARLSGMSAIRDRKRLELIVELEYWKDDDQYDRTGLEDKSENIMGVDIPYLKIPVRSGRNICILIETAAKNHRLKAMGYHSAKELNKLMIKAMQEGKN